jgi:hypothetical protein
MLSFIFVTVSYLKDLLLSPFGYQSLFMDQWLSCAYCFMKRKFKVSGGQPFHPYQQKSPISLTLQALIEPVFVLSMFMLSFIFVTVCGLFEWNWKLICAGFFYPLFICALLLEIQLSKREGLGIPLTCLILPLLCVFQARTWFSNMS